MPGARVLRFSLTAVLAATAVVLPGHSGAAAPSGPVAPPLKWGPCPEGATAPGLECSTLDVPLDYDRPDGRTIELAVSRLQSKDESQRRGVLLTNSGGPGISGLVFPAVLGALGLPKDVLDRYDVIGLDPRGVGRSTPVTCDLTPAQLAKGNLPPWARGPADVAKQAGVARKIAQQCASSPTRDLLPHMTTANTARDLDRIRQALGEPKVSYLGYSYGSYLGSVYTTLFPGRSDRIVIDSNVVPGGYDRQATRLQARGAEDRFPDFARWLAARNDEYGLGATPKQVRAKFFELAARLDRKPLPWLDGSLFRGAHLDFTYTEEQFADLAGLWRGAVTGVKPELPPSPITENFMASHLHVVCNDSDWPRSVRSYQRDVAIDRVRYPMLGASTAGIRPCAFWPTKDKDAPVRIGGRGPADVLMVQNERDPGSPLVGARKLRRALGERAVLVTVDDGGHGVYVFDTNRCANRIVTAFLVDGDRPARDRSCPAE